MVLKQNQGMGTRFSTRRYVLSDVKVDDLVDDVVDLKLEFVVKIVCRKQRDGSEPFCLL